MTCGIFSFFRFIFNFFNMFQYSKNSKQNSQERDIERNVIFEENEEEQRVEKKISYKRASLMIAFYGYLYFVSFLDQFMYLAILPIIKEEYQAAEITHPLVILAFLCIQVILSPFLTCYTSYYNRKMVICVGLFFYSFLSFGCTFIPQQGFWLFILARLFVAAMAESCLATVPLVIADLFHPEKRTRVLGFYTFSKAFCCVFACIFGTTIIDLASQHWRYALWTTPALGLFGLVLAIIIMKEPEGMDEEEDVNLELDSSCFSDLKKLLTNCSFLAFTAGVLCYSFVYGANVLWVSKLLNETRTELDIKRHCLTTGCHYDDNVFYGVINCAMNLIGLIIGMELSKRYKKSHPYTDPVLCGIGLMICAPILTLFIVFQEINFIVAYVFIAIAGVFQAICLVPILNMKLDLVDPKLRKTANVMVLFFTKLIGSLGPSVFIKKVSEALMKIIPNGTKLTSMQFAMTIIPVMALIGAVFFFITVNYMKKKKKMAEMLSAIIIQK